MKKSETFKQFPVKPGLEALSFPESLSQALENYELFLGSPESVMVMAIRIAVGC